MSTSVTLSKDTNSSVSGINLKWAYVGLGTIKEISLIYFKNSNDADIVSKEIPSGTTKINLPSGFESGQSYSFQLQVVDVTGLMAFSAPLSLEAPWFLQAPVIDTVSGGDQALMVHLEPTSNILSSSDTVEFVLKRADNFVFWIIKAYASSGNYTLSSDDNSALLNDTSYRIACMFQPASDVRYGAPSPLSTSISATPSNLPNIPQSISAVSVGTTDYSLQVSWTRPNDFAEWSAGGFSIVIKSSSTMGEVEYVTLTSDVLTYTFSNLPASRAYAYGVRYVNQFGQGPELAMFGGNAVLPTQVPSAPYLYSIADGDQEATITWQSSGDGQSPITNYKIYRGASLIATVLQTVTTYTATGLQNGYEYSFKVVAVNAIGDSPDSAVLSSTPYGQMSLVSAVASGKTITAVFQPNGRPLQDCKFVAIPADLVAGAGGVSNVADFFADIPQIQINQALSGNVTVVKTFSSFSSDIALYAVVAHNEINSVQYTSTLA